MAVFISFLSTPSVWRATLGPETTPAENTGISIHALRVEGDGYIQAWIDDHYNISIHALRVEGDLLHVVQISDAGISIHALRVEGDDFCVIIMSYKEVFLSTPSVWRATGALLESDSYIYISIHALRVEGD